MLSVGYLYISRGGHGHGTILVAGFFPYSLTQVNGEK